MALHAKKLQYRVEEVTPGIGQFEIFKLSGQKQVPVIVDSNDQVINEISKIASCHDVSFSDLEKTIKTDKRISPNAYLRPGNSFSGGTLARDVNYLIKEGKKKSFK